MFRGTESPHERAHEKQVDAGTSAEDERVHETAEKGAREELAKNVMKIPARMNPQTAVPIDAQVRRKVAGYARVSTDHDEQLTSYEAQLDYCTTLIKEHDDWEFAGMYSDEGVTGTSTKKREGFQPMVADALVGKIE